MLEFEVSGSVSAYPTTRIKVVGVGGAGGNTLNALLATGTHAIDYIAINTDAQALELSRAHHKLRIGEKITKGRGAGASPEVGKAAAEEDKAQIIEALKDADIIFLTGGLGGGTGSGALPVITQALKELDILTVCIVTKPFAFEGKRRMQIADQVEAILRDNVDTLITIHNEKLLTTAEQNMSLVEAFGVVNTVIGDCVRSIVDIIMKPGHINVDFSDVKTIMKGMGAALMGTGRASGDSRAEHAALAAIASPFLDHLSITGARSVLINVAGNSSLGIHEVNQAASIITQEVDARATIIIGSVIDESMGNEVSVTVIATGFHTPAAASAQSDPVYHPFLSSSFAAQQRSEQPAAPQAATPIRQEQADVLAKDHPLRDILPSLEKRLKEQYAMNQDELEIPTLLRKLIKEQQALNNNKS